MHRFTILLFATLAALVGHGQSESRPNFIIFLVDDMRDEWHGALGGKVLTPNFDRFYDEGAWFERAYVTSPICTPSRYSLNTGQFASRAESLTYDDSERRHESFIGSDGQRVIQWNTRITPTDTTVAQLLSAEGYHTGFVGKCDGFFTHEEAAVPNHDLDDPDTIAVLEANQEALVAYMQACGFDWASHLNKFNITRNAIPELRWHNFDWTIQGAFEFLENQGEAPFFLMVSMTGPHLPDPTKSLEKNPERRFTEAGRLAQAPDILPSTDSIYARLDAAGLPPKTAGITWLDDALGALLDKVEALDLTQDTYILYVNDHNDVQGKGSLYEGGARSHFAVLGADVVPAKRNELVSNVDVVPTLLELAGVAAPDTHTLDGSNLAPLLTDPSPVADWRDYQYLEVGLTRAVVSNDGWKYIAFRKPPNWACEHKGQLGAPRIRHMEAWTIAGHPMHFYDSDQLYNLNTDPNELHNLARADKQSKASKMRLLSMQTVLREYLETLPGPFGEL